MSNHELECVGTTSESESCYATLLRAARQRFSQRCPRSREYSDAAKNVLPGGNTRSVLSSIPFPIVVTKARDSTITDLDGHHYVDFLGDFTAGLLGHSDGHVRRAIITGIDGVGLNVGGVHAGERVFAALMCERFDLERVRFTNSGTEANLLAITCALWHGRATERRKIIVFDGGYHGAVIHFKEGAAAWNAPYDFVLAPYNDAIGARHAIERHASCLAAVLFEPMLGSLGCLPAQPEFVKAVAAAARAAGAILIADEVQTSRHHRSGMLRSVYGVDPDLITYGKYLGGGFSFGALGGCAKLLDVLGSSGELPHGGTFNNNIASMVAGATVLRESYTAELAETHTARGERLRRRVEATLAAHYGEVPLRVTGYGSTFCIHAVAGVEPRQPLTVEHLRRRNNHLQELLAKLLLERGVYIGERGLVTLSISHTDGDADTLVRKLEETLLFIIQKIKEEFPVDLSS